MNIRIIGAAVLLCTCFGTGIIAIQVGVSHFTPLIFTLMRLCVAAAVFAVLLAVTRRTIRRDRRFLQAVALVGLLGVAIPYVLSAFSLRQISSTLHSILTNLIPVFSVVLAHFSVDHERLTWRTAIGVLAAVAGASIVVWGGAGAVETAESLQALGLGVACVIIVSLSMATSSIVMRRRLSHEDSLVVTGGQMAVGLLLIAPVALLVEGIPDLSGVAWRGWSAVLWAALFGGVVGFLVLFYMIRRWGVMTTSVASTAVPLVTATVGVSLLGETLSVALVVGGMVLIAGVLIVLLGSRRCV